MVHLPRVYTSRVGLLLKSRPLNSRSLDYAALLSCETEAENMTSGSLPGPKNNIMKDACEVSLASKEKEERKDEVQ